MYLADAVSYLWTVHDFLVDGTTGFILSNVEANRDLPASQAIDAHAYLNHSSEIRAEAMRLQEQLGRGDKTRPFEVRCDRVTSAIASAIDLIEKYSDGGNARTFLGLTPDWTRRSLAALDSQCPSGETISQRIGMIEDRIRDYTARFNL